MLKCFLLMLRAGTVIQLYLKIFIPRSIHCYI